MKFYFVLWLLLRLGSIVMTSLFSLFYVTGSVTDSYTEDEWLQFVNEMRVTIFFRETFYMGLNIS